VESSINLIELALSGGREFTQEASMSRFFRLLTVVLISATMAFAQAPPTGRGKSGNNPGQGHDDHNDDGPIQAGYAIVTPVAVTTVSTSGGTTTTTTSTAGGTVNSAGLVVFATYGLRSTGGNSAANQAGVLPPDLTTSAMLFVDTAGQLSKNDGVAIVNPNGSNVNVSLTLRKADGTTAATGTVNVPAHQQVAEMVTQLFSSGSAVASNITGTLVITSVGSSNLPISVIGLRFRGANFSTIPATNLSGNTSTVPTVTVGSATAGGAGAVLLPQFAADGGWATELVLVNSGTSAMTVRVDLFKQDGTPLTASLNGQGRSSFTNITIPAGGVTVLAPRDANGNDDF
jgi:hypothetical protein